MKSVVLVLAATLGGNLATAPARAEIPSSDGQQRKVEAVGPWAYKRLERAHKAIADARYDEALEALDEMQPNPTLNAYEQSLMWQAYGFVYSSRDEYAEAADSFQKCLSLGGLPEQAELQTRYNVAQLYVMLERHDEAIAEFHSWLERVRNPSPTAYYMLAMAYLQKGDKDEALRNAERCVERASVAKEPWLQLLVALRLEQKEYAKVIPILEDLVVGFPKKMYWLQLSAVYSELGEHEKALAVLELSYEQGMLTEGGDIMSLAQLYLYNQIPYRAAEILEDGMEKGIIVSDARAWQLLADSWLNARDRERAIVPLAKAAELSESGDAYVRLAQLQLEREEYDAARQSLSAALEKGDVRSPGHVYVLLGIASINEARWTDAERAFTTATEYEPVERMAHQWLNHLENQRTDQSGTNSRYAKRPAGDAVAGDEGQESG